MLEKTFRPAAVEAKHYARWEGSKAFAADPKSKASPYTIMMPPANVTGSLHIGHALTFSIQDILIRYYRMKGRDALWQPGTDHAGIATQMVVERQLAEQGLHRRDLGREAFLEKVWEWKAQSGGTIMRQLRRLGTSADWPRERFTMDDGLSLAVRRVFVDLYKEGLIYRDKRLVNWDPKLHTAISDLEVQQVETKGKLWHFKYPIEGEAERFIVVATTRPETMLGDSGVAVHPDDDRYKDLVGKHVILPLVGRRMPIVADDYADPETGSGAVKMTPAHDFNDFEVGRRRNLELINIFDQDARLNDRVPEKYRGLDRYAAREQVVCDLEAAGLIDRVEEHLHKVPHGDRGGDRDVSGIVSSGRPRGRQLRVIIEVVRGHRLAIDEFWLVEHAQVERLAQYATVPVINGLTDLLHPCQVLCDLFTLHEKREKLKGLRVAFIGDGNNVCNSWLYGAAKMGIHFTVACPKGYEPHRDVFTKARAESEATYAVLEITHDAARAAREADVLYTDVWASMGHEEQRAKRMRDFKGFQVNQSLVNLAQKDVQVMHCLPAHRGEEITDEVMDGLHSIILDQAENRLHLQKAILLKLLGDES